MVKVLHVLHGLGSGGVETYLINLYRNINREKVEFHFLLRTEVVNKKLKKELEDLGGKIFITNEFPKKIFKNYKDVREHLKKEKYDVMHVHANALIYTKPIIYGKKYGIKNVIIHSHSLQSSNKIGNLMNVINKKRIYKKTNEHLSCSKEAGQWMYGKEDFTVIKNAIDLDKFKFNKEVSEEVRAELELEGKFVIGCTARFIEVKNHKFLLKIFKTVLEKESNSRLILAGDGELKKEIEKEAIKLGIFEKVKFLGARDDVFRILQAIDVFCMPSLSEGLSFSLVEAQVSGAKVITSDRVPREVKVTKNMEFISLLEDEKYWASRILKKEKRNETFNKAIEDYDIKRQIKIMEKIYKLG